MSERQRLKDITEFANSLGYQIAGHTKQRHIKFTHPGIKGAIFVAPHSSEPRAMKNAKSQLKRKLQEAAPPRLTQEVSDARSGQPPKALQLASVGN